MKVREIVKLGYTKPQAKIALQCCSCAKLKRKALVIILTEILESPSNFESDQIWAPLADAVQNLQDAQANFVPRKEPAPWKQWGDNLEESSIAQLQAAVQVPIAVRGALMPDAHTGYGLPIGGVLATDNAVIPYAVGMDIACRMRLTVFDMPASAIESHREMLKNALYRETLFGVGAGYRGRYRKIHEVMDEDWDVSPVTRRLKDKAWAQLGSSGSGNHFAEFGTLTLSKPDLGLEAGKYLAVLSHSGSRGTGGEIAQHYSRLAMELHPELPRHLKHLAWLDMNTQAGQEYWSAMELMGKYAAASHEIIHKFITKNIGTKVIAEVENHHNFAWRETHFGQDVIVHRKGATPAHKGVMGIIPGSMATPGFVVRGLGNEESLCSCSHGAGRVMSRSKAKQKYRWADAKEMLTRAGVEVLSAGVDEVPMCYKNINEVMNAQQDLVEIVARFDPRIVRMADGKK